MSQQRPCRHCHTPFAPAHWREVYCTAGCRYAAQKAKWRRQKQRLAAARQPLPQVVPQPRTISVAEVLRQGRTGASFTLISDTIGRSIPVPEVREMWEANATQDDQLARDEGQAYLATQHTGGRKTELAPVAETFARNAFGNNVSPVEYGRVGQSGLSRSVTGCAAAWVAGT